jgi:hypothetical protein
MYTLTNKSAKSLCKATSHYALSTICTSLTNMSPHEGEQFIIALLVDDTAVPPNNDSAQQRHTRDNTQSNPNRR